MSWIDLVLGAKTPSYFIRSPIDLLHLHYCINRSSNESQQQVLSREASLEL